MRNSGGVIMKKKQRGKGKGMVIKVKKKICQLHECGDKRNGIFRNMVI